MTDSAVGSTHMDSAGCRRVVNRWGFNSFVTEEDARVYARGVFRRGRTFYIFRLPDGSYDYSARADVADWDDTPPWRDAELVGQGGRSE